MPASPVSFAAFGVEGCEPMVFGGGKTAIEAQSRVIDGVPLAPRATAATPPRVLKQSAPSRAPTAAELKRQLRARLRVVNAEIRTRSKLERERDTLTRLLAAADDKTTQRTRADVRSIRNVAG